MDEKELHVKKYEELYKLSKESLEDSLARFRRLDERASRHFTALNILLIVSSFATKYLLEAIVPPSSFADWLAFLAACAFLASILFAFFMTFRVLHTKYVMHMPMTDELIEHFNTNDYLTVLGALVQGYKHALEENNKGVDHKLYQLGLSYRAISFSIMFVIIFSIGLFIRAWNIHY